MKTLRTYIIGTPMDLVKRHGRDILDDPRFLALRENRHHGHTTTYDHCLHVTLIALEIAKEKSIKVDVRSLVRGSLLHDYYCYDNDHKPKKHLRTHGQLAAKNAERDFGINGVEHDVICNHMWPIHPFLSPLTREGWLCCLADKIASCREYFGNTLEKQMSAN